VRVWFAGCGADNAKKTQDRPVVSQAAGVPTKPFSNRCEAVRK